MEAHPDHASIGRDCGHAAVTMNSIKRLRFPRELLGYLSVSLPKFRIMAIDRLLCLFDGVVIVIAIKLFDMAVRSYGVTR
jgi:hypothetical protein